MENGLIPNFDGAPTLQDIDLTKVRPGERARGTNRQYVRFFPMKRVVAKAVAFKTDPKTGTTTVTQREPAEEVLEMVEIITPGDKNHPVVIAEDWHKREFARQYLNYRTGKGIPDGQSVDDCEYILPNIATELKHLGCHTQEQLADASDKLCEIIPDGHNLRQMAQAMVKADLDNRSLGRVNLLKTKVEDQEAQIEALKKQVSTLIEAKKTK